MNFDDGNPVGKAVNKAIALLAAAFIVLFLILLTSCACDPHVEYCGEPNVSPSQ